MKRYWFFVVEPYENMGGMRDFLFDHKDYNLALDYIQSQFFIGKFSPNESIQCLDTKTRRCYEFKFRDGVIDKWIVENRYNGGLFS